MNKRRLEPPTYFLIFLLLAILLHFVLPIIRVINSPYKYIGIALLVFGIWLNLWADGLFKRKNTTVKPFEKSSALILEGPFRFSRHPMYLGMVVGLLGVAIILGSLIAFLVPIAFLITMHIVFIRHEEKALEQTFGQEYLDYKKIGTHPIFESLVFSTSSFRNNE
ncbi:isoprenylcysteine carboxylmethyltransferase family protein [candidate division WOR-3 bacterium]|nr:isoprenylcysteine carboxylmethyltransferase family protein [candidate division WOR-3 bacterium]